MLIEQITKYESRGLGARPLVAHVLLKLIVFITKQKFPTGKSLSEFLFTAAKNIAGGSVTCFSHLEQATNFNHTIQFAAYFRHDL